MVVIPLVLLLIFPAQAIPIVDTTDDPMAEVESSNAFFQTSTNEISQYEMTTTGNTDNVSTMNAFSNSTAVNMVLPKIIFNTTRWYYNYTYSNRTISGSSSTLSTGALIGIVFAVIAVLCCAAICSCLICGDSKSTEVWVAHRVA